MESFYTRYKNPLVLIAVVFIQAIGLATQIQRPDPQSSARTGSTRLIRVWAVSAITPVEHALISTGHFFRNTWYGYVDLHNVRKQNLALQAEIDHLRMEKAQLSEEAGQARRLQALLGFKEHFASATVHAQVIAGSGTEQSRIVTIDRGASSGLAVDMPVVTPDGIVGKVKDVFRSSAQVLLINDRESGAGVVMRQSRLQGILKGSSRGQVFISYIMSDEKVEVGEQVVTSGGDRIYPKGFPVGVVTSIAPDRDNDPFLAIQVKPAADLDRLEEVLVITKVADAEPDVLAGPAPTRAADVLAQRLPGVPASNANKAGAPALPGTTAQPATPSTAGAVQQPANIQKNAVGPGSNAPLQGQKPAAPVGQPAGLPKRPSAGAKPQSSPSATPAPRSEEKTEGKTGENAEHHNASPATGQKGTRPTPRPTPSATENPPR